MSPLVDTNQFEQRCYENTGHCIIGVVKLREHDGRPEGLPVRVGETVWLNEIEERLTKNAPKSAADNPFANGDLALVDATSAQETTTPVEPSPEPPVEEPEAEQRHPDAPDPSLPPGALPPGTPVPQAVSAPEPVETLDDAALAAAEAAKASGAAPTSDDVAPETVVEQIEETAVEQHTAETGVAVKPQGDPEEGTFKEGEEVATPDAPAKVKDETGDKPNFAKKTRSK